MTGQQQTWFFEGTGEFVTATFTRNTIAGIAATLAFLYVCWLLYGAYNDYCDSKLKASDVIEIALRSVFVLMIILYLVRP